MKINCKAIAIVAISMTMLSGCDDSKLSFEEFVARDRANESYSCEALLNYDRNLDDQFIFISGKDDGLYEEYFRAGYRFKHCDTVNKKMCLNEKSLIEKQIERVFERGEMVYNWDFQGFNKACSPEFQIELPNAVGVISIPDDITKNAFYTINGKSKLLSDIERIQLTEILVDQIYFVSVNGYGEGVYMKNLADAKALKSKLEIVATQAKVLLKQESKDNEE